MTRRHCTGLPRAFNFHLCSNGNEVIKHEHRSRIQRSCSKSGRPSPAISKPETTWLLRSSKDRTACDDVFHELVNRLHLSTLECIRVIGATLVFTFRSEFRDEVPSRNVESFSMLLNFWSFETHSLSNNQQDSTANPCFVDVSNAPIPGTFD